MNKPDEKIILEHLREVPDPEVGINIVDLGLIYKVDISDQTIRITMTLSTTGCPMGDAIMDDMKAVLKENFPDYSTVIDLVWEPAWSSELISPEGRKLLGFPQQ